MDAGDHCPRCGPTSGSTATQASDPQPGRALALIATAQPSFVAAPLAAGVFDPTVSSIDFAEIGR